MVRPADMFTSATSRGDPPNPSHLAMCSPAVSGTHDTWYVVDTYSVVETGPFVCGSVSADTGLAVLLGLLRQAKPRGRHLHQDKLIGWAKRVFGY